MNKINRPLQIPKTRGIQKTKARHIGDLTQHIIAPVIEKRAGLYTNLKMAWPEIAGQEIASFAAPVRLDWPRRHSQDDPFKPAILVVACVPHRSVFLQHQTMPLLERINLFLGFHAIERIVVKQENLKPHNKSRPTGEPQSRQENTAKLIDPAVRQHMEACVEGIENEKLKTALLKLGEGLVGKKQSDFLKP